MEQLVEFGEVMRGQLGITIQDFTPGLAEALGIGAAVGAVITQVEPESAAEAAGLQPGDLIISVDGRPVAGSADLRSQIGLKRLGREIEIEIIRDGETLTLNATLRQGRQFGDTTGAKILDRLSGAKFRDLQPDDPQYSTISGVLVTQVDAGSSAARSGLDAGDIVLAVNREPVASVDALRRQIASIDGPIALTVQRGSARLYLLVR